MIKDHLVAYHVVVIISLTVGLISLWLYHNTKNETKTTLTITYVCIILTYYFMWGLLWTEVDKQKEYKNMYSSTDMDRKYIEGYEEGWDDGRKSVLEAANSDMEREPQRSTEETATAEPTTERVTRSPEEISSINAWYESYVHSLQEIDEYDAIHDIGYDDGYKAGYEDGYKDGYEEGYNDGYNDCGDLY